MIVKNESLVISRCLASAFKFADGVVITDTGSDDDTINIIQTFCKEHNKPVQVIQEPFKGFGPSRESSAAHARRWAAEQGWPMSRTYLLFLDADMVLHNASETGFDKSQLTKPCYMLTQKNAGMSYPNVRLARLSHGWRCSGRTHEYWYSTPDCPKELLTTLWIDDRNDGGSRGRKFERDIELLMQDLNENPNNGRAMFYLGQSYRALGKHKEAIHWYKKRIEHAKSWEKDESWYSLYQIGHSYKMMASV